MSFIPIKHTNIPNNDEHNFEEISDVNDIPQIPVPICDPFDPTSPVDVPYLDNHYARRDGSNVIGFTIQDLAVINNIDVGGSINIGADLSVIGNATIDNDLHVFGIVDIAGDIVANSKLSVVGDILLANPQSVSVKNPVLVVDSSDNIIKTTIKIFFDSDHISVGNGAVDANKPIILNANGYVDPSFIEHDTMYYVGSFTPTPTDEYPDTTGETKGAAWMVQGVDDTNGYTFNSGDLTGRNITNSDFMVWGSNGWSIISGQMNPSIYYLLDGTRAITAPFAGGGQQIKNIADGTDDQDAVTVNQISTLLDYFVKVDGDTMTGALINTTTGAAIILGSTDHGFIKGVSDSGGDDWYIGRNHSGALDVVFGKYDTDQKIIFTNDGNISFEVPNGIIVTDAPLQVNNDVTIFGDDAIIQLKSSTSNYNLNYGFNIGGNFLNGIGVYSDGTDSYYYIGDPYDDADIVIHNNSFVQLRRRMTGFRDVGGSGFGGSGYQLDDDGSNTSLIIDKLTVRKEMQVYELNIEKIKSGNGSYWFSDGCKAEYYTEDTNSYFFRLDAKLAFPFVADDIIRIQTWTGDDILYFEGIVTGVDNNNTPTMSINKASAIGGDSLRLNTIYDIVRVGNISNVNRQGAVYITSNDDYSPYMDVIYNYNQINATPTIGARLGLLDGITDSEVGLPTGTNNYGLYASNVYLKGTIVASSGKIANWTIKSNRFASPNEFIVLDSNHGLVVSNKVIDDVLANDSRINVYFTDANNWGLIGKLNNVTMFSLGSVNNIAGWTFDNDALYTGTKTIDNYTANPTHITISSSGAISANKFYIGTDGSANFKGNLEAPSGKVGNFDITDLGFWTDDIAMFNPSYPDGSITGSMGFKLPKNISHATDRLGLYLDVELLHVTDEVREILSFGVTHELDDITTTEFNIGIEGMYDTSDTPGGEDMKHGFKLSWESYINHLTINDGMLHHSNFNAMDGYVIGLNNDGYSTNPPHITFAHSQKVAECQLQLDSGGNIRYQSHNPNDGSYHGFPITFSVKTSVPNGSLVLTSTGTLEFTPAASSINKIVDALGIVGNATLNQNKVNSLFGTSGITYNIIDVLNILLDNV